MHILQASTQVLSMQIPQPGPSKGQTSEPDQSIEAASQADMEASPRINAASTLYEDHGGKVRDTFVALEDSMETEVVNPGP